MQSKAAALEEIAEERRQVTAETRITRDRKAASIRTARLDKQEELATDRYNDLVSEVREARLAMIRAHLRPPSPPAALRRHFG